MSEFGSKLRILREEKGITQQELADIFYVAAATVSRWESGKRFPDLMTAKKLADYYGVSLDDILDEKEFPEYVRKAPVMETDYEGRIQTALYTLTAAAFIIRLIGLFLFPEVHDGSIGARMQEILNIIKTAGISALLTGGVILSFRTELDQKATGIIASFFFACMTLSGLFTAHGIESILLNAAIPLACLLLTIRFFFLEKSDCFVILEVLIILWLLVNVFVCFFVSETYSYASTSFVTKYRFLWSFAQPIGICCLMILLFWQIYTVQRKRKLAGGIQ